MKKLLLTFSILLIASGALAADFCLKVLKQAADPTFVLSDYSGKLTYYDLVHNEMADAIAAAGSGPIKTNEVKLRNGGGVSVKLGEHNYNVHINFPKAEMGGRSYGWTKGQVGDWSDTMYLQNISKVMDAAEQAEIESFYHVIFAMLGASNSSGLEKLELPEQRVANNFLAILTAEQYRRIQKKTTRWDDALIQVTLLAPFHSGQSTFKMFYTGEFTESTKKKNPGVYSNGKPGPLFEDAKDKKADFSDYHQFSGKTPDMQGSNRSGLNLVRKDFQKMGTAITKFEQNNPNLKAIQKIVGGKGYNIYADIAAYLTLGSAKVEDTATLSKAVAKFMIDTYQHADDITKSLE